MRTPPRLIVRTLAVTLVTVSVILSVVFIVLTIDTPNDATQTLQGEEWAIEELFASGPIRIFSLNSIDAAASAATRDALVALGTVAFGSFVLAALGSLWLARTLTTPICVNTIGSALRSASPLLEPQLQELLGRGA